MKIENLPESERPREKLLSKGRTALSNAELLAILIDTGAREKSAIELANELLATGSDGIRHLGDMSPEELSAIRGIGLAKACRVIAAVELGRRAAASKAGDRITVTNPNEIANLFMEEMRYYNKEYFKVLMLNSKGEILEQENVAIGDLNSAVVHPREVFVRAVRRSAAAIVLIHNHPSGCPEPSSEDIATTKRLEDAGSLLGIKVLDHIIIGDGTYISFKSEGLF